MWIINIKIKVRIGKEYQQTGSTVTRPHVMQFTAHASLVAENHLHWWSLASASFFHQRFVVFWWWSCVFGHYSDVGWFQFLSFEDLMRLFVDISWLIVKMCELTTYLLFLSVSVLLSLRYLPVNSSRGRLWFAPTSEHLESLRVRTFLCGHCYYCSGRLLLETLLAFLQSKYRTACL